VSLEDVLTDAAKKGARAAGDHAFADLRDDMFKATGGRAEVPDAKRCETTAELAGWFARFALACRANLPAERQ